MRPHSKRQQSDVAHQVAYICLDRFKYHMMTQTIYQVDAFSPNLYEGNPAAVCILPYWIDDAQMQSIAMENNLAETAFTVRNEDGHWDLRWFTPTAEVDLCGHATLATAHILYETSASTERSISFDTKSGTLKVTRISTGRYLMDFPTDQIRRVELSDHYQSIVDTPIIEIYKGKDDYLFVLANEQDILRTQPNIEAIRLLPARGLIITSPGSRSDISSRCFYPNVGVIEDPVTGSAHTTLTPYWAHRLRKNKFRARQLSHRGGYLDCIYKGSRTSLIGDAVTYLTGTIYISSQKEDSNQS